MEEEGDQTNETKPKNAAAMADRQSSSRMEMARAHIDHIRKHKFSIGEAVPNPLVVDLQNAVLNLSSELYAKDIHFIMELIQNAEDNNYPSGVEPTLEFVLTEKDVTGTGAPATLLVFNNEVGFSKHNIESICSIGRSTKKGQRHKGFIGEKGIGFKSVFLVSAQPYVFSNGYQIKFSEAPNENCEMGYIVPEWVPSKPAISDLRFIYGNKKALPGTTIVLPLKLGKLESVKKHLEDLHPENLLFLHKIKVLSIRMNGISHVADSEYKISISNEKTIGSLQSQGADSRMVRLSSKSSADKNRKNCFYFIYAQVFPVKSNCVVDSRKDIKEWTVCLAFPVEKRLKSGTSPVGIFSFLPTSMVTNFPFIVQADFILTSSREAILLDNKWNLGILGHVPEAYVSALMTCTALMTSSKSTEIAKNFPIPQMLEFFPLQEAPLKQLNRIRDSIKEMLLSKKIVPCQSQSTEETVFCQPRDVVRLLPDFRKILSKTTKNHTAQGKFILHSSVDMKKYSEVWDFLGVPPEGDCYNWHAAYIKTCNFLSHASMELSVDLLCFIAHNWKNLPHDTMSSIPLLKYVSWNNKVLPCSISDIINKELKIHLIWQPDQHLWLNKWNVEMQCPGDMFLLHDDIVALIRQKKLQSSLETWLTDTVGLAVTSVSAYCLKLYTVPRMQQDPAMAVLLAHLVYHAALKKYVVIRGNSRILPSMPVVDDSGNVHVQSRCLVPSSESKWVKLFGSGNNSCASYVKLANVYSEAMEVCGCSTNENDLLNFLVKHEKAVDLPHVCPQDVALDVASGELTCEQAFLLLEWIKILKRKGANIPEAFFASIKNGKWMKTYSGFSSPTCCYLSDGSVSTTLADIGKAFKVLSTIDEWYYEDKIRVFKDELRFIGVQSGAHDMYQVIFTHLTTLVSTELSRDMVISMLRFIRYAREDRKIDAKSLKVIQEGKWLMTDKGYDSPFGVAYLAPGIAEAIPQFTYLKVVDLTFYESDLDEFVDQLKLLGVLVNLKDIYKLIPQHLKFPDDPSELTKDAVLLLLECIRQLGSAAVNLIDQVREMSWMRTSTGFVRPSMSLMRDPDWDILVNVVPLPVVDEDYYGKEIKSYKVELESIGVAVDLEKAHTILISRIERLVSSNAMTRDIVLSILSGMKLMSEKMPQNLPSLVDCLSKGKWVKTCQGYRACCSSILLDSKWATVSQFVELPFIDVAFYGSEISSFRGELKILGVVVDFNEGAHLVARGLNLPENLTSVAADCGLSLLHCASSLRLTPHSDTMRKIFTNTLKRSPWLKTHMGYRNPERSLIFNPEWNSYLEEKDGPFIDQGFYGTLSGLELDELKAMGAETDTSKICASLFQVLTSHKETSIIMRIYRFLQRYEWSFDNNGSCSPQLWIPDLPETEGKWVNNSLCVLHDRGNLFGSSLHILDRFYGEELLSFFSKNLGVDEFPSVSRCVDLWNYWVNIEHVVSSEELRAFWGLVAEQWNPSTEEVLKSSMVMLPANTASGSICFVNRADALIPDNLQLKKSFLEAGQDPLFVWFPKNGSSSLTRQYEIYKSLGVRKLSESIEISLCSNYENLDCSRDLIGRPLIKIVLAFLANPLVSMPVEVRQQIAKSLLDISIFGTDQPLMVTYVVHLPSSGKKLEVQSEKMVVWDKNSAALRVHKPSWENGTRTVEFVVDFARAVSEIVLSAFAPGLSDELRKIIKMGLAFGLKEEDVDSLLRAENLELFDEDIDFLECPFADVKVSECTFSDVKVSESTFPDVKVSECTFPDVKVSECTFPDVEVSECTVPDVPASSRRVPEKHPRASPCTPETTPSSKRARLGMAYNTRRKSSLNKENTINID